MDWTGYLEAGERVRWEGRPAPRCFTFRNWRHSLFGVAMLALCIWWLMVGIELGRAYDSRLIPWIPLPFLLLAGHLGFGHLLVARLEWERTFYAITDRRILALKGLSGRLESLRLAEVTWFRIRPLGQELGTVRIRGAAHHFFLVLSCIEHPRKMTDLLETEMEKGSDG